jgi:hypothetical protein
MSQQRGPWYLITGLVLGAVAGLLYAWLISPVHYVATSPSSLRGDFKDSYRLVIAQAFAADGDIGRASSRLALLGDAHPSEALAAQAQQILAQGGLQSEARSLALLAMALSQQPVTKSSATAASLTLPPTLSATGTMTIQTNGPSPTYTQTLTPAMTIVSRQTSTPTPQGTPTETLTPTKPTGTPPPTATQTATPGAPFVLRERSQVCDQTAGQPMLQVQLNDAAGNPVAGIEIHVTWQGGEDVFYTGLMPAVNPGFADFAMTPGVAYTLRLTDGGQPVNDLAPIQCSSSQGTTYWGGWYILMQQP